MSEFYIIITIGLSGAFLINLQKFLARVDQTFLLALHTFPPKVSLYTVLSESQVFALVNHAVGLVPGAIFAQLPFSCLCVARVVFKAFMWPGLRVETSFLGVLAHRDGMLFAGHSVTFCLTCQAVYSFCVSVYSGNIMPGENL